MNEKDTLKQYIDAQLKNNVTSEAIKQQLISAGWNEALVSEAISQAAQAPQPTMPPQTPAPEPVAMQPTFGTEATAASPQVEPQATFGAQATTQPAVSEKYGVMNAFSDAFSALKANSVAVIVMMVLGFIATAVSVVLVVVAGVSFFLTTLAMGTKESALATFIMTLVGMAVLYMAVVSLTSAFTQSLIGLAINDGAEGKKSNIKTTIFTGAKRTLRVTLATLLCGLIIMIPGILAVVIISVMAALMPSLAIIAYLLALVAVIAGPILALRIFLMPVIALFEADVPLKGLYGRARHLMRAGGAVFMIKLMAIFFVLAIILSIILPSESKLESASLITTILTSLVGSAFYLVLSAVLVVFYRHRKAVRG